MSNRVFYGNGASPAIPYALAILSAAREPGPDVTHLLLPVPTKDPSQYRNVLSRLPEDITIIGGNLSETAFPGKKILDLLHDPQYLAQNAAITAHCALKLAMNHLPCTLDHIPVLVIGWGRIGKCLSRPLQSLGAQVAIYARKESDRAMAQALGLYEEDGNWDHISQYRLIFNTVPAPVLPRRVCQLCREDAVLIELASRPGIEWDSVIDGRGLPGKEAPESSGKLIAETVLRLTRQEDVR